MKKTLTTTLAGFLLGCVTLGYAADAATLKPGDPAPKLQSGKFVQGEPVKAIEKGKAYLVEFWATWCGPCVATIPHVNELHQKYADKGLIVIGQNCWERDESLVKPFIEKMGSKMTYRVALDDKSTEKDGAMAINWMKAAGQNGIPAAFLINKEGTIAWIGHPATLNEKIIDDVLAGTFDLKKAAAEAEKQAANKEELSKISRRLSQQMGEKNWSEAEKSLDEIAKLLPEGSSKSLDFVRLQIQLGKGDGAAAATTAESLTKDVKNAQALNQVAWLLVTSKESSKPEVAAAAQNIASRANDAAEGKSGEVLDTLARATWLKGDQKKAIELQEKAISLANADTKENLQKALESYKAGKLPAAGATE